MKSSSEPPVSNPPDGFATSTTRTTDERKESFITLPNPTNDPVVVEEEEEEQRPSSPRCNSLPGFTPWMFLFLALLSTLFICITIANCAWGGVDVPVGLEIVSLILLAFFLFYIFLVLTTPRLRVVDVHIRQHVVCETALILSAFALQVSFVVTRNEQVQVASRVFLFALSLFRFVDCQDAFRRFYGSFKKEEKKQEEEGEEDLVGILEAWETKFGFTGKDVHYKKLMKQVLIDHRVASDRHIQPQGFTGADEDTSKWLLGTYTTAPPEVQGNGEEVEEVVVVSAAAQDKEESFESPPPVSPTSSRYLLHSPNSLTRLSNLHNNNTTNRGASVDFAAEEEEVRVINNAHVDGLVKLLTMAEIDKDVLSLVEDNHNNDELGLRRLDEWNFDPFQLDVTSRGRPLTITLLACTHKHGLMESSLGLDVNALVRFVMEIETGYLESNPYHNRIHAADVTQAFHYFLTYRSMLDCTTLLDRFVGLLASSLHDYKHPGVNSFFYIHTSHQLSLVYNDISVLENMHLSSAFQLMRDSPECDVFAALTKQQRKEARETMIQMVLATDMSSHFDVLNSFQSSLKAPMPTEEDALLKFRRVMLKTSLHCADVSNPARTQPLAIHWAERIQEEFYLQGDLEKLSNLNVSLFMDRDKPAMPKMQVGFIVHVVKPMMDVYCTWLQPFKREAERNLQQNLAYWKEREGVGAVKTTSSPPPSSTAVKEPRSGRRKTRGSEGDLRPIVGKSPHRKSLSEQLKATTSMTAGGGSNSKLIVVTSNNNAEHLV